MAFILKFNTGSNDNCETFDLFDTSGLGVTGYTGSGGNPAIGDVTDAEITLSAYSPAASTTEYNINVFDSGVFPNTDGEPAVILGTSMGFSEGTPITSGLYNALYAIHTTDEIFTSEHLVYLDCQHLCCASKLWAKWAAKNCECNGSPEEKELLMLATKASATIEAIHRAIEPSCNKIDEALEGIEYLNAICSQNGCGCGH